MATEDRRVAVLEGVLEGVLEMGGEISGWAILPNHYHLLIRVPLLKTFGIMVRKLHSGVATQWNREDGTPGRQVWYRYRDRRIRGERHYYASLNYINANPVKHGYVQLADEWTCSSIHGYLESFGREYLRELWLEYPPRNMGKGWDDF